MELESSCYELTSLGLINLVRPPEVLHPASKYWKGKTCETMRITKCFARCLLVVSAHFHTSAIVDLHQKCELILAALVLQCVLYLTILT